MTEIESILNKYIQGSTTEAENALIAEWLKNSPENKKRFFSEKDIWDAYGYHTNQKQYNVNFELKSLRSKLNIKNNSYYARLNPIIRVAAVILIAFGLGWATRFIPHNKELQVQEVALKEIMVPKGQVNQLFLADGTRIWINSESRLKVPSVFTSAERIVQLSGEAFFEVAKDKKRPFKVEVKGQTIEVLGTSFNVRAYPNDKEVQTTLSSGRINLSAGHQQAILNPGEQAIFNRNDQQLIINKVNPAYYSSWKEGRFEFQNENLQNVFEIVERWYDVEISYNAADFKGMRFSGVIKRNKDITHFLNLLNHSIPIDYHIKLDQIFITPKKVLPNKP
jgi:ferric-dicitrate binding protein FerR (iron transport regulator)